MRSCCRASYALFTNKDVRYYTIVTSVTAIGLSITYAYEPVNYWLASIYENIISIVSFK